MLCMQIYLLLGLPGQLSSSRKKSDGSAHTSVWVIRFIGGGSNIYPGGL